MMLKWLWCLLFVGFAINQNDFLPPNYVYLEPITDFYQGNPINIEVIITDRNEIEIVYIFYRSANCHLEFFPTLFFAITNFFTSLILFANRIYVYYTILKLLPRFILMHYMYSNHNSFLILF